MPMFTNPILSQAYGQLVSRPYPSPASPTLVGMFSPLPESIVVLRPTEAYKGV